MKSAPEEVCLWPQADVTCCDRHELQRLVKLSGDGWL